MPEQLSPAMRELRRATDAFIDDVLRPLERELGSGEVTPAFRRRIIDAARLAGIFGMSQPVEFGGTDAGPLAVTIAREAVARANLRVAAHIFGPRPGVLQAAQGRLREVYLEPLMRDLEKIAR